MAAVLGGVSRRCPALERFTRNNVDKPVRGADLQQAERGVWCLADGERPESRRRQRRGMRRSEHDLGNHRNKSQPDAKFWRRR